MVVPPDGLSEQVVDVQDDQLVTGLLPLVLWNGERVRNDDLLDTLAVVHLLKTVTAKETVGSHAVHFPSTATLDYRFRCGDPGCRFVHHVVDDEHWPVLDVADKGHHRLDLGILEILLFVF